MAGSFALLGLLWMHRGQERVMINEFVLVHSRELFKRKWSKSYVLPNIERMRVDDTRWQLGWQAALANFGMYGGSIVFYCQQDSYEFGAELSEAEATHIVKTINRRFPSIKIAE